MAESEEALQLKRRARRRLVGAIAVVTFVVIILPLILDKEPGPSGPPLNVQIPGQDSRSFDTRVLTPAPEPPAAATPPKTVETTSIQGATPSRQVAEPRPKPEPAVASKPAPSARDEELRAKAALNDQTWAVSLDAFSDKNNVKQLRAKLSAAGVQSYTESVKTDKGTLTRVRAGPYTSKEAAEKVRAKLDAMGLKPGAVVNR